MGSEFFSRSVHNTRSINDPKTKVTVFQGKKHVELMFMFIIVEVDVIEIAMYVTYYSR